MARPTVPAECPRPLQRLTSAEGVENTLRLETEELKFLMPKDLTLLNTKRLCFPRPRTRPPLELFADEIEIKLRY